MEAEAMAAIFDNHFAIKSSNEWSVTIYPETGDDIDELNHVGIKLLVNLPETYPEALPNLDVEVIKGLAEEHQIELRDLATVEAEANLGAPSLFAIVEKLREWLLENNTKGLDDVSMHAQMMRKQQEQEKEKVCLLELCWVRRTRAFVVARIFAYAVGLLHDLSVRKWKQSTRSRSSVGVRVSPSRQYQAL